MKMFKQKLLLSIAFGLVALNSYSLFAATVHVNPINVKNTAWVSEEQKIILSQASNIDPNALHTGLIAYQHARRLGMDEKQYLTIIDYAKPSTQRRLWVINLQTNTVLFNTYVSHGKNSGSGIDATSFSNSPQSKKSSIGVYLTDSTYFGKDGYSLRLRGLDMGFNDNAYNRAIVMHGAKYVNAGTMSGVVGHSWGCPAVSTALAKPIIDAIKQKTLIVAYYPDQKWLTHSQFLT